MNAIYAEKLITTSRAVAMALPCPASTIGYTLGLSLNSIIDRISDITVRHELFNCLRFKSRSGSVYFASLSLNSDVQVSIFDIIDIQGKPASTFHNSSDETDTIIAGYRFGRDGNINVDFIYNASEQTINSISACRVG